MSNIIDSIQLSGSSYDVRDKSATTVVEITQSDYDNLPSSAKTSSILYIITDGSVDYITSAQCQTQINNSISGKQDTLSAGTNITIVDNVISAEGGGGKAVVGGRGITVTSGENADTVSFNLPISGGTGTNSIKCGETNDASGGDSFAIGANGVKAKGQCSFAGGSYSEAKGFSSMAFGRYNTTNNYGEVALGFFNKSNGSSSAAGNSSGNTLFSVGNGTNQTSSTRHNAFEIRQNGDIYITLNDQDVKLQDQLGGGGSSYTAGDGIDITNDVISVTGKVDTTTYNTYTAATATAIGNKLAVSDFNSYSGSVDTAINSKASQSDLSTLSGTVAAHTANTDIHVTIADKSSWNGAATNASNAVTALGGLSIVKLTQAQYDSLATKDNSTLYVIVN